MPNTGYLTNEKPASPWSHQILKNCKSLATPNIKKLILAVLIKRASFRINKSLLELCVNTDIAIKTTFLFNKLKYAYAIIETTSPMVYNQYRHMVVFTLSLIINHCELYP